MKHNFVTGAYQNTNEHCRRAKDGDHHRHGVHHNYIHDRAQ
jgi:hypothetical protein